MELATRVVSIERGRDPRDLTLVAFGGSGPVHGCRLAQALGIPRVILPAAAGRHRGHRPARRRGELRRRAHVRAPSRRRSTRRALTRCTTRWRPRRSRSCASPPSTGAVTVMRSADARYVGQGYELTVPVPAGPLDAAALARVRAAFDEVYAARYGYAQRRPSRSRSSRGSSRPSAARRASRWPRRRRRRRPAPQGPAARVLSGDRRLRSMPGLRPLRARRRHADRRPRDRGGARVDDRAAARRASPPSTSTPTSSWRRRRDDAGMTPVDPITLGVIWGALQSIAVEIGTTVHKTAYSEQAREGQDFSVAVFDAAGAHGRAGTVLARATWARCRSRCATRWPRIRSRRCGRATPSC